MYLIIIIIISCIVIVVVIFYIFTCSRVRIKKFIQEVTRVISVPQGLDNNDYPEEKKYRKGILQHEPKVLVDVLKNTEKQDLIKSGSERQIGRNSSGGSGTSVGDNNDSSGCSTGGDSDCSSGTDALPPSSDSGTVQEEPGFPLNIKPSGEVRFRPTTGPPPYVCLGLNETRGYVSVPNLAVGLAHDEGSVLPPSTSGMMGTEMGMNGRRTSTGYISMPTSETKEFTLPLGNLGNMTLPHEDIQGHLPVYSRHNYPYKKVIGLNPPYIKAQSLPWLNAGYVAVAQADAMTRETPRTQGYVAVGSENIPGMKHQSSLMSTPVNDKSPSTPDEDLHTWAYCKVGARDSPTTPLSANSPSPGYVSITPDPPIINRSAPAKNPYVTCAMAEALSSPTKQYLSGDIPGGRWAHNVLPNALPEETRDVISAPVEGSRSRTHHLPTRPNTTETNSHHNRGLNQFKPHGHSLSKQSSGYASGNVSQETLSFHEPVVMSPKRLLARSQEPHSVVYSPNHNSSMV